jgi:hypothetical protein
MIHIFFEWTSGLTYASLTTIASNGSDLDITLSGVDIQVATLISSSAYVYWDVTLL